MTSPAPENIYIINPDTSALTRMLDGLERDMPLVCTYTAFRSEAQALKSLATRPAALVIAAYDPITGHGISLVRPLRDKGNIPLIFTGPADEDIESYALETGACDYFSPAKTPRAMAMRVRNILMRDRMRHPNWKKRAIVQFENVTLIRPDIIINGDLRMVPEKHSCTWKGKPLIFTPLQYKMLADMAAGRGRIKSYEGLRRHGGPDLDLAATIKRIRAAFKKVDPAFDALRNHKGEGYSFVSYVCEPQTAAPRLQCA
jgi:two-component system response regulator ChvI